MRDDNPSDEDPDPERKRRHAEQRGDQRGKAEEQPVAEQREVATQDAEEHTAQRHRPADRRLTGRVHDGRVGEGKDQKCRQKTSGGGGDQWRQVREVRRVFLQREGEPGESKAVQRGRRDGEEYRDPGEEKEVPPVHAECFVQQVADLERS